MWGSRFFKPLGKQAARYALPKVSASQSMWAGVEVQILQTRGMWLPCLSGLTIFNLREMMEKAVEDGEAGSAGTGLCSLVQGMVLEGTMVCSVIKRHP